MNRRILFLAAFIALPTVATAQKARSQATKHESAFKDDEGLPSGPALRARDIEDLSPIKLLIDKRKDLKLSDAQTDGLKKAEGPLKEKNAPLYKAVDSLVREMKPGLNRTAESDARINGARIDLHTVMASIQDNYDAASKEAVATFDADQQAKANDLLAKLKEEGEKKVREKLSGRK